LKWIKFTANIANNFARNKNYYQFCPNLEKQYVNLKPIDMAREPKSAYTPKQVADYLKDQITTRGEGGLKTAFTNQFFNHFDTSELQGIADSISREVEQRHTQDIENLRRELEAKSGKAVELR
jgi:hypothetical protein